MTAHDQHERIKRRMETIDNLAPEVRALVHEYGWEPVSLLMEVGVKKAHHLEQIILACRNGPGAYRAALRARSVGRSNAAAS